MDHGCVVLKKVQRRLADSYRCIIFQAVVSYSKQSALDSQLLSLPEETTRDFPLFRRFQSFKQVCLKSRIYHFRTSRYVD